MNSVSQQIEQLFVRVNGKGTDFRLNPELTLQFDSEQSAAAFLVSALRFWIGQADFFCHDHVHAGEEICPETEWVFDYKTPSDHPPCVRAQQILSKIFGSCERFNALPFVQYHGDRQYIILFNLLAHFAENGHDSTVRRMKEIEQEKARATAEAHVAQKKEALTAREQRLAQILDGTVVSDEVRRQLLQYSSLDSLVIANPDIAAVVCSRSEHGSSGGCGYYSQAIVFYGGQQQMQEWQWRHRFDPNKDQPWLAIHSISKAEVTEQGNQVTVTLQLVNNRFGERSAVYQFDKMKTPVVPTLSEMERTAFLGAVSIQEALVIAQLERAWENNPKMINAGAITTADQYTSYRRPSIKERQHRPEIGVAAFVTEEQIDHAGSDPQIRYELYVITAGKPNAERRAENHGYNRQGGAFLTIINVTHEHVIINTPSGQETIPLH